MVTFMRVIQRGHIVEHDSVDAQIAVLLDELLDLQDLLKRPRLNLNGNFQPMLPRVLLDAAQHDLRARRFSLTLPGRNHKDTQLSSCAGLVSIRSNLCLDQEKILQPS